MTEEKRYAIETLLADFMDKIEEWSSNVVGTPKPKDMRVLDSIYAGTVDRLSEEFKKQ